MIRQAGETGQLYGSVNGRDIADAIKAEGGKVDRSMIALDKPIKTLGVHEVKMKPAR
jgi:large subunit ribosomal protein L9